jgi:hypothetical protein
MRNGSHWRHWAGHRLLVSRANVLQRKKKRCLNDCAVMQSNNTDISLWLLELNTIFMYQHIDKYSCRKYAQIRQWERYVPVFRDLQYFGSWGPNVTVYTDIYILSLEELDVNGKVVLNIDLKELASEFIVYTELSCLVFGCSGVVL